MSTTVPLKNGRTDVHWANLDVFLKDDKINTSIRNLNCLMSLKAEHWSGSNYVLFYIAVDELYNPYNKIMSNQEYLEWYIEFLNSIGFTCYFEGIRLVDGYSNESYNRLANGVSCYTVKIDQADFKSPFTFFATWQSVRYIYSFYNNKVVDTMFSLQARFKEYLDNSVIYQIAHYITPRDKVNNTWTVLPRVNFCYIDYNQSRNSWGEYPSTYQDYVCRLKTKEIFKADSTSIKAALVQQIFYMFNGVLANTLITIDEKRNIRYNCNEGVIPKPVGEDVRKLLIKIKKSTKGRIDYMNQILELLEYPGPSIEAVEPKKVVSKVKRKSNATKEQVA